VCPQYFWVHAAAANQSQTTRIRYRTRQLPTTAPNHSPLHDGVLNTKQLIDPLIHVSQFLKIQPPLADTKI
jgi:chemotaxis signal transduction protein